VIYDINTAPLWQPEQPPTEPSRRLRVRVAVAVCLAFEVLCVATLVVLWAVR
jgi:hypothetical protein